MAEIIINNDIKDGLEINYSLILIKGSVILNNGLKISDNFSITNNNIKQISEICDNNFKCLLELDLGDNVINLNCENVKKVIKIIYVQRISSFSVTPLYIINKGHDGLFQAPKCAQNDSQSACKRINTACRLLQTIIAEKLYENDLGRKAFVLNECRLFESSLKASDASLMSQKDLWTHLAREIMESSLGNEDNKFIGFLSCTKYNGDRYLESMTKHEDYLKITDAYVALGGGGLGLFGTPCLYTWPETVGDIFKCFKDDSIIDKSKFMDDSAYRGTLGACFSTTLGSVLHELCHTFDLGHTALGIMGRGFDNIQNIFLLNETETNFAPKDSIIRTNKDEKVSIKIKPPIDTKRFIRKHDFSSDLLNKAICVDDTCFTKSCASILAHHKWFNNYTKGSINYVLTFDNTIKLLKSTLGIRVIELRRFDDEMVIFNWNFVGKILKYNYKIEEDCFTNLSGHALTVFVMDNNGHILKEKFLG